MRRTLLFSSLVFILIAGCGQPAAPPAPQGPPEPAETVPPAPPTRRPTSVPVNPRIQIIGEEEVIFRGATDRCAPENHPDLPVRAFRDASGMIQMNLSFTTNYRLIGPDFDSMATDCQVTLRSDVDPDPSHYSYKEWMGSTYTFDGQTIYALIHNEWYGREASQWSAARSFGPEQGADGWYWQAALGGEYRDMEFDAGNDRWQGPRTYCHLWHEFAHPDLGCEPTWTWVSPVADTVTVSGTARDDAPGGGNGVRIIVRTDSAELWSDDIPNGDPDPHPFAVEVPVAVGDRIHISVNALGDSSFDSTVVEPRINIGPDPCPSGVHTQCQMMSITHAVSTDGGATFVQPPSPDHLVAVLPYRWEADAGQYSMWQPSNIVKSPYDDYFYALVQIDRVPVGGVGFQGMCLMRTLTLDDPKSWRAWDGSGFNLRFVDPYREEVESRVGSTCTAVSQEIVGALAFSLTYNEYLDRFVIAGQDIFKDPPGFYYSWSEDLIHWAPKRLLMAADLFQLGAVPYYAYPSFIDPDSPSRSFDIVGRQAYMYYSRINGMNPLDFDLLRVRVEFEK